MSKPANCNIVTGKIKYFNRNSKDFKDFSFTRGAYSPVITRKFC